MNRDQVLERAIEFKECSEKFESVSFLDNDKEFFEYVIKELERTAPEVRVQEQLGEISNGSKTINQVRKEYDLEPIEGGDIYLKGIFKNNITIFVEEEDKNCYKVEVADSSKRIKRAIIKIRRLSKSRFSVINYQFF